MAARSLSQTDARDLLNGFNTLRSMGVLSPRVLKMTDAGISVPYIRAGLDTLAAMGALEKLGPNAYRVGPRFDELRDAADWCADDGLPNPWKF